MPLTALRDIATITSRIDLQYVAGDSTFIVPDFAHFHRPLTLFFARQVCAPLRA